MRKFYLLLTVIVVTCVGAAAQNRAEHIIVNDTIYIQGRVALIGKGKLEIRKSENRTPRVYSLDEISEYQMGEKIFVALNLPKGRQFARRYIEGDITLYRSNGLYIMKTANGLKSFGRKDFRTVLAESIKCEGTDRSLTDLRYTKAAVTGIISASNAGKCNTDFIPYKKFGIVAGYNVVTTHASPNGTTSFSQTNTVPVVGVFMDFPMLFRRPGLYFTLEGSGFSFQSSYYRETPAQTDFMVLRIKGASAIANIKFVRKTGHVRPYVKAGALASFLQLNCPIGLMTTTTNGSEITINKSEPISLTNATQFGFNTAVGLEVPVYKKKSVHAEFRYSRSIVDAGSRMDLSLSNVGITAGFSF